MSIYSKEFDYICEECKKKSKPANVWDFLVGENGVICCKCGKKIEPGVKFFTKRKPMTIFAPRSIKH
ncbi:MAG: hypothetical protein A2175_00430 [Candidatus Nealsonbacteria bacterium RBG_13_42_11]|uniref:Uncharacterized protein n=1 Tax=Candidatus Nealsonbacteria bacterium RBG_13_42_11 TaxID=1801663 RepID=A0A1G2E080_9BACT|nr:MAG: hypothetical protein A2175_00430 [Candidatus Nealsonbacteria bacterium RBG_13_42_11]